MKSLNNVESRVSHHATNNHDNRVQLCAYRTCANANADTFGQPTKLVSEGKSAQLQLLIQQVGINAILTIVFNMASSSSNKPFECIHQVIEGQAV